MSLPKTTSNELYKIWARAFNSWHPPGHPDIYLYPTSSAGKAIASPLPPCIFPNLKALEITAWNPLGRLADPDTNHQCNQQLYADLEQQRRHIQMLWPSSGFDLDGWNEDGFVLWLRDDDDDAWVVDLARRYDQGAIYRYRFEPSKTGHRLWRQTLPVLMKDGQSQAVEMIISLGRAPGKDDP